MRRAKIRPSINLSASRRNIPTPPSQDKELSSSKQDLPAPKTGLRSATRPSVAEPTLAAGKKDITSAQQTQPSPQQNKVEAPGEPPKPTPPSQDPLSSLQTPDSISPVKETPSSPTKPTPDESPSKASAVRRKRITAVPNLGQPRLRSTPSQLPVKVTSKPQFTAVEKENEVGKKARGGGGVRGRKEPGDGVMRPPQPPPIQRVPGISSTVTSASSPSPAKEHTTTAPSPKETSHVHVPQTTKTPSQINPVPVTLSTPVRPALARSESISEKTPSGSENIYQKKLRELKDKMVSETPAKRRRNYVKKKTQPPERSKMTMSDLIYFNPKTSPMKNTLGNREKRFPRTIMTEHAVSANNSVNSSAHNSDNEAEEEEKEEDVDPFAPQVKIGPDGSIILDSTSLVKDASPAKTLHLENSEAVQEESSHTTYASFGKRTYTTAWSVKDTAKFYMALSAVGTDFTMINAMFPKRTRQQIKNKFKREERLNRIALDKAIKDRKHFDMSLFNKEPSSDSETENRVTKKMKGAKGKGRGQSRSKGMIRKKVEDRDCDVGNDSDVESVEMEEATMRDETLDGGTETTIETVARLSEASDEEINMETILSQPTRSGRQPKFKSSYTVEEPPKRTRGPYQKKKGLATEEDYALKRMERLSQERVKALAQKQEATKGFAAYQSECPTLQHPPDAFTRQTSLGGAKQSNGSPHGGHGRVASPSSRGTSTITTPMGRFIVSVPQHQRHEGESISHAGPASPKAQLAGGGVTKPIRSHIFVISSPDGTQNIIQVPVQTETPSSPGGDRAQNPPATIAPPRPRPPNPMTTPGIMLKNLAVAPQQNQGTVIRRLAVTLPQTVTQPTRDQLGIVRFTNPMSTPHLLISHGQKVPVVQSGRQSSTRKRYPEPITVQTGSNKTIVMSPLAAAQTSHLPLSVAVHQHQMLEPVSVATTSHNSIIQQCPTVESSKSPTQVSETHNEAHLQDGHNQSNNGLSTTLVPDIGQNVGHISSDTNHDWVLRDVSVGHKVDISTTDSVEMEIETEEAFVPAFSNQRHSPLHRSGTSQVTGDHATEEHLSAQDILEQMTFEEGVGGHVGANMEIAINEEIITQIASETTVE
ncbi:uncharacterized protein LOC117307239 [Asterias rubens]|uniref:uncharacterized protein LOC117307239 n=1 Tax=Asterias rubens TaxID=7604 RepID=UPI001455299F|nr:uncharacterized protein LOC117307239 [Asterias rubens]